MPGPQEMLYPTLLGQETLRLKAYSLESVVAEKFDALVNRGLLTSRLKDCYDLWALAQEQAFDGALLQQAIQATLAARERTITAELPVTLTSAFAQDEQKQQQWAAFRSGKDIANTPATLTEVLEPVVRLLAPIWAATSAGQVFAGVWEREAGEWREMAAALADPIAGGEEQDVQDGEEAHRE